MQKDIQATDTSSLVPNMSETDVIQALVLQFLQHDGYVGTARAFAEDMKKQKEALSLDPGVKVDGVSIRDDEDANNRQRKITLPCCLILLLTTIQGSGVQSSKGILTGRSSTRMHIIPTF